MRLPIKMTTVLGGASDVTPPTCVITSTASTITTAAFTCTFTFSEPVTGFELGDITCSANASASNLANPSPGVYTATITPSAVGSVTVDVAAGVCTDAAGNPNTAATQFSILSIFGAPLWLRADAGTYQASGGAIADDDGEVVGQWQDQSGAARHLTETTEKPILKLNIKNGLPVIRFDGSNDRLTSPAFAVSQPYTIFAVAALDAVAVNDGAVRNLFDGVLASRVRVFQRAANNPDIWSFAAPTETVVGNATDSNWSVFAGVYNGASSILYRNGVQISSGDIGANAIAGITVGAGAFNGTEAWDGDVGEFIVVPGALSDAQRQAIQNYLGTRWAISLT